MNFKINCLNNKIIFSQAKNSSFFHFNLYQENKNLFKHDKRKVLHD